MRIRKSVIELRLLDCTQLIIIVKCEVLKLQEKGQLLQTGRACHKIIVFPGWGVVDPPQYIGLLSGN